MHPACFLLGVFFCFFIWAFIDPLYLSFKFLISPSTRLPLRGTSQALFFAGSLLLSLFCFLKILNFPFDALGPRGAPTFCPCRK